MKRLFCIILLIIMGFCFFHCSKKAMIRKFYVLETQSSIIEVKGDRIQPLAGNVDVRDFRIRKAFEQTRIAVRSESHELNYYYYHHWAARPSSVIPDMVSTLVDRSGIFCRCARGFTNKPDFIIQGQVDIVERIEKERIAAAHLNATLELTDEKTDSSIVRHAFDLTVDLKEDKSMNGFARAISYLLEQESLVFIEKMSKYFRDRQATGLKTKNDENENQK
ncbi:MAG: membrane integrity-associated transporter subunit PqiC [Deltaproteobacteria bacterium]|nr:membrane integrity-associated transporter subunit PqiC [Deltaproteobacteria bacterium]